MPRLFIMIIRDSGDSEHVHIKDLAGLEEARQAAKAIRELALAPVPKKRTTRARKAHS